MHKRTPSLGARLSYIWYNTTYMQTNYVLGLLAALFLYAPYVQAFDAVLEIVPAQYEVVSIQNPETEQLILGELEGDPEMFEVFSETPFILTAEIRAIPESGVIIKPELSGIVIKQKEIRGVEEVARMNAEDVSWDLMTDSESGLKYQAGPYFSEQMASGTYRIEISSPENKGKYMLLIGNQSDKNGYGASLADIKMVYQFYGLGTLRMFSSPYVHYPIGIIILVGLIGGTWYLHHKQKLYA